MKKTTLPKLTPIKSTMLPWNPREVLPAVRRAKPPVDVATMPVKFTHVLVDLIAEDVKLSKGKARKAIRRGEVKVNGEVVYDPDLRVDSDARVVFGPEPEQRLA